MQINLQAQFSLQSNLISIYSNVALSMLIHCNLFTYSICTTEYANLTNIIALNKADVSCQSTNENKQRKQINNKSWLTLQRRQKIVCFTSNCWWSMENTIASPFWPDSISSTSSSKLPILSKVCSSSCSVVGFALFTFSWNVPKTSRKLRKLQLNSSI